MRSFTESNDDYEEKLGKTFGAAVVKADLRRKHRKMAQDAFQFLRGTCFRWAECAPALLPDEAGGIRVPSVGDAHAGNLGLWRDVRGRLVWGINDFDEAALLPYSFDLIRLGASIALADPAADLPALSTAVLEAYAIAIEQPRPFVLEREHLWLRDRFAASDDEREDFWEKLEAADAPGEMPAGMLTPLLKLIEPASDVRVTARSAGVGSLGRPRFAATGEWLGGPLAGEVKGAMLSCWGASATPNMAATLSSHPSRPGDPSLVYAADHVGRRIGPNSRKIEFDSLKSGLLMKLAASMGAEIGSIHAISGNHADILSALRSKPGDWLSDASDKIARWTRSEHRTYAAAWGDR